MMVLSGLYIAISNSLPATDYVKYIQIWFIFSLIYPFGIIIIQMVLKYAEENKPDPNTVSRIIPMQETSKDTLWGKLKNIHCFSCITITRITTQIVIPVFAVLFCLSYFVIGLYFGRST